MGEKRKKKWRRKNCRFELLYFFFHFQSFSFFFSSFLVGKKTRRFIRIELGLGDSMQELTDGKRCIKKSFFVPPTPTLGQSG